MPASALDYEHAFADRHVWGGSDCGPTVRLADGRVLWLFGDTWNPNGSMARNSLVMQDHGRFSRLGGWGSALPEPAKDRWLWPTAGWLNTDGTVSILSKLMAADASVWGFKLVGHMVSAFNPITREIGAGRASVAAAPVSWDGAAVQVGEYTYAHGWHPTLTFYAGWGYLGSPVLARFPTANPDAAWSYFAGLDGTTAKWSTLVADLGRLSFDLMPWRALWMEAMPGGTWLASSRIMDGVGDGALNVEHRGVHTWTAPNVWGPFTHQPATTVFPTMAGAIQYCGRVSFLGGERVAVESVNGGTAITQANYGIHFLPAA